MNTHEPDLTFADHQALFTIPGRIRRREKLFLTLKGYEAFMYAWYQFPTTCTEKTGHWRIYHVFGLLLLIGLCTVRINFEIMPISPSF